MAEVSRWHAKNPATERTRTSPWGHLLVFVLLAAYLTSVATQNSAVFLVGLLGLAGLIASVIRLEWGLAIVPLVLLNPVPLTFTGTNLIISEFFLLIIFGVWFLGLLSFQEEIRFPRQFLVPVVFLLGTSVISIAAASYVGVAVLQFVRFVEIFAVLFVVILMTTKRDETVHLIVGGIILGGMIAAVVGMIQFVTGEGASESTRRVYGYLGGGFGCAMATTLFLSFSVLIHPGPRTLRMLGAVATPVLAVGLVMGQTRTWLGAFVVAVLLSALFARKEVRRILFVVIGLLLAVLTIVVATNAFGLVDRFILQGAFQSAFRWQTAAGTGAVEEISLLMRLNAWAHALELFLQHPLFGIGLGNLRVADYISFTLAAPSPDAGYIDNQTVQFFVEGGVLAGIAWLVYAWNSLLLGLKVVRRADRSPLSGTAHGLFGSLMVFLLGSNFWVITPSHELFSLFVMVVALLMSCWIILNGDARQKANRAPAPGAVA